MCLPFCKSTGPSLLFSLLPPVPFLCHFAALILLSTYSLDDLPPLLLASVRVLFSESVRQAPDIPVSTSFRPLLCKSRCYSRPHRINSLPKVGERRFKSHRSLSPLPLRFPSSCLVLPARPSSAYRGGGGGAGNGTGCIPGRRGDGVG